MLCRTEMDDLRVRIADADGVDELRALAERMHAELERARAADAEATAALGRLADRVAQADRERAEAVRDRDRARRGERDARLLLAGLIAASKAALAAFADQEAEAARAILGHELYAHGWNPAPGSHAPQILADAATAFRDAGLTEALTAA